MVSCDLKVHEWSPPVKVTASSFRRHLGKVTLAAILDREVICLVFSSKSTLFIKKLETTFNLILSHNLMNKKLRWRININTVSNWVSPALYFS